MTLTIEQVDNATLTARFRAGDFSMRLGYWTDDIADPNEITSYFGYYPNIQSQHSGWKNDEFDTLFDAVAAGTRSEEAGRSICAHAGDLRGPGRRVPLYESPYPVVLKTSVKGFIQIPLGNNIFSTTSIEK